MGENHVRSLLLAGGQSKRMGRDKRLLSAGEDALRDTRRGDTLVGHAFGALREAFGQPWVLVASEQDVAVLSPILGPSARFLIDRAPGSGPLSALADALGEVDRPHAFLLATDMPRVTSAVLGRFNGLRRALSHEPEALVPTWEGVAQVTCAFYRRSLAASMRASVLAGTTSLVGWLGGADVDVHHVGDDDLRAPDGHDVFENLNTPKDHERYLRARADER